LNVINQVITDTYSLYHGDCVEVIKGIPSNSIHYIIFSPPFRNLYVYSNSDRDMGNSKNDEEFDRHFSYLVPELYRILLPGRLLSFHCMDMPAMKERDGYIGLKDFPGDLLRMFQKEGFIYHSKVTIWKDPLTEATRTKALGLMHKQLVKDSAMCRQGLPDYLITVRKPGDNPEPIAHPDGLTCFAGEDEPRAPKREAKLRSKDGLTRDHHSQIQTEDPAYSHQVWRRYASPVWMDINQSNTLQRESARENNDERHIAPLQLDVIERALTLWTNPGDIVLTPYGGIMSEAYKAVEMGRKAVAIELKESYFNAGANNMRLAVNTSEQQSLF
jgi:DNA modification methylase